MSIGATAAAAAGGGFVLGFNRTWPKNRRYFTLTFELNANLSYLFQLESCPDIYVATLSENVT